MVVCPWGSAHLQLCYYCTRAVTSTIYRSFQSKGSPFSPSFSSQRRLLHEEASVLAVRRRSSSTDELEELGLGVLQLGLLFVSIASYVRPRLILAIKCAPARTDTIVHADLYDASICIALGRSGFDNLRS